MNDEKKTTETAAAPEQEEDLKKVLELETIDA